MCDCMIFPATIDEFMEEYKVVDSEHVYSNGTEMVPIFRMKQWFEHEQGKADVQQEVTDEQIEDYCRKRCLTVVTNEFVHEVHKMVSTVPPKHGRWTEVCWKAFRCSECNKLSEYNSNFCPNCGAYMKGELFRKEETE